MESIVEGKKRECFICRRTNHLEVHHCIHGTAGRMKADKDGLTVHLCHECHRILHDTAGGRHMDHWLMEEAQRTWMLHYNKTEEEFRQRYGKSYL